MPLDCILKLAVIGFNQLGKIMLSNDGWQAFSACSNVQQWRLRAELRQAIVHLYLEIAQMILLSSNVLPRTWPRTR